MIRMKRFSLFNRLSSHKPGHQNAQGMVEFALVMPLLFLLIFGILEVGRLMFTYSTVITASREAVRYGSATGITSGQPQYKDCVGIRNAAQRVNFLGAFNMNADIDILYSTGDQIGFDTAVCPSSSSLQSVPSGGWIKVSIRATFTPLAGIVPLISMTLRSDSQRTILGIVNIK